MTKIVLVGNPIPKKNSMIKTPTGLIQSKEFQAYETDCLWQLKSVRDRYQEGQYWVKCHYYRGDGRRVDLTNLLAATHDILQKAGIIDDDRHIISLDGSRMKPADKKNPRTEIRIDYTTEE